jgi:hypothetical protein
MCCNRQDLTRGDAAPTMGWCLDASRGFPGHQTFTCSFDAPIYAVVAVARVVPQLPSSPHSHTCSRPARSPIGRGISIGARPARVRAYSTAIMSSADGMLRTVRPALGATFVYPCMPLSHSADVVIDMGGLGNGVERGYALCLQRVVGDPFWNLRDQLTSTAYQLMSIAPAGRSMR